MEQLVKEDLRYFNILSLDGGGSKGVYTIGILKELEQLLGKPLHEHFNLIFGTSTGSIITALLGLGCSVDEIEELYFEIIPDIMGKRSKTKRSQSLKKHAQRIFDNRTFDEFKTCVGIVTTNSEYKRPMIFKSFEKQAHGRRSSFQKGFGATIADAVVASCAAFPYFDKVTIKTLNQGHPLLLDGGFVANNPSLFAIIDARNALSIDEERIRVLSLGTGEFPDKPNRFVGLIQIAIPILPIELLQTTLSASANTSEQIRKLVFPNVKTLRINESFSNPQYATDLLESDTNKLIKLMGLGRESFAKFEHDLRTLFSI
jgi:uncharacterized protein